MNVQQYKIHIPKARYCKNVVKIKEIKKNTEYKGRKNTPNFVIFLFSSAQLLHNFSYFPSLLVVAIALNDVSAGKYMNSFCWLFVLTSYTYSHFKYVLSIFVQFVLIIQKNMYIVRNKIDKNQHNLMYSEATVL